MPRIARPVNHRVISQTVVVLIGVACFPGEQHSEWEASTRRYLSEGSMRQLEALNETPTGVYAGALTG